MRGVADAGRVGTKGGVAPPTTGVAPPTTLYCSFPSTRAERSFREIRGGGASPLLATRVFIGLFM